MDILNNTYDLECINKKNGLSFNLSGILENFSFEEKYDYIELGDMQFAKKQNTSKIVTLTFLCDDLMFFQKINEINDEYDLLKYKIREEISNNIIL